MSGQGARIGVIATARPIADLNVDGLPFERLRRWLTCSCSRNRGREQKQKKIRLPRAAAHAVLPSLISDRTRPSIIGPKADGWRAQTKSFIKQELRATCNQQGGLSVLSTQQDIHRVQANRSRCSARFRP